jgi:hypothetical protein
MSDKWMIEQVERQRSEPSPPSRVVFHEASHSSATSSNMARTPDVFPRAESPDTPFGWIKLAWEQNGLKR